MFRATLFITLLGACAFFANAQRCSLAVGAWKADPGKNTEVDWSTLPTKEMTGFTATALNQATGRLYRGVLRSGDTVFPNIPQGNYRITLRKPGFKTSIESYLLTCQNVRDRSEYEGILMVRGKATEVFRPAQSDSVRRLDIPTVIGDTGDAAPVSNPRGDYPQLPPPPAPRPAPKTISGGVLNGRAVSLPKPPYPPAARAVRASGAVMVQVLIDEEGRVISATPAGGNPLLVPAAVAAARAAKFPPTLLSGQPVKVSGIIVYNFVP